MELSWLKRKIESSEIETIEKEHLCHVDSDENINIENNKLPFGEDYFTWRVMKSKMDKNGYELWGYDNDGWHDLAGRAGYVLTYKHNEDSNPRFLTDWTICTRLS